MGEEKGGEREWSMAGTVKKRVPYKKIYVCSYTDVCTHTVQIVMIYRAKITEGKKIGSDMRKSE